LEVRRALLQIFITNTFNHRLLGFVIFRLAQPWFELFVLTKHHQQNVCLYQYVDVENNYLQTILLAIIKLLINQLYSTIFCAPIIS
jgi:hypothetical protein